MTAAPNFLPLQRHPHSEAPDVRALDVAVAVSPDGDLTLRYRLHADLGRLRIPVPRAPRAADGLWAHTCFELFAQSPGQPAYHEFNFSPSREWAAYAFRAYREREPDGALERLCAAGHAPWITVAAGDGIFELHAVVPRAVLPVGAPRELRVGLTAVVEDAEGVLSYWSLRHPGARPDFHHHDGFALAIEAPLPTRARTAKPL